MKKSNRKEFKTDVQGLMTLRNRNGGAMKPLKGKGSYNRQSFNKKDYD